MQPLEEYARYLHQNKIVCRQDEPMKQHTTFKIGGPAALFIEPESETQLSALLCEANRLGIHLSIIGRGSNLLVNDNGIDSPVVCLGERFSDVSIAAPTQIAVANGDTVVYAQAGASLTRLCRFAQNRGLAGLEFAFGIPGTIGGAVFMNAGAYGGEIKDVITAASHLDPKGQKGVFTKEQLALSYRSSVYSGGGYCITGAWFRLKNDDPAAIQAKMDDYLNRRQQKQPLELPSAGSTFKRPEGNYASALIDQCGLKGRTVGGAQVSEKHAGFVVNTGEATAADVLALIEAVRSEVCRRTGYRLECEIKLM